MMKCPYCPKKFVTHHGLGGHLSGPCGIKLKAAKAKPKAKPKPHGKTSIASIMKAIPVRVDFGKKTNAELQTEYLTQLPKTWAGNLASGMRDLAVEHRQKADELDKMADRMSSLA